MIQGAQILTNEMSNCQTVGTALKVAVGAAHSHINLGDIKAYSVPFPPIEQQNDLIRQFDVLDTETQRLATIYKHKLAAVDELKKSLLHHAFSGEL